MIDIIHRLFLGLWQGLRRAAYYVRHFFRYLYTGNPSASPFPPNATPFSATMCCYGCLAVLGPLAMLALSVGIMRAFLYPSFKKKKWAETFFWCLALAVGFIEVAVVSWIMLSRPSEYCMFALLALCGGVAFVAVSLSRKQPADYRETKKSYSRCKAKYSKRGNVVRQKFMMVQRNCNTSKKQYSAKKKFAINVT